MSLPLLHTAEEVLARAFIKLGLCAEPYAQSGWPVYKGPGYPASPGEAVVVTGTPGAADGRLHNTGEAPVHYGVQVAVRAEDNPTGAAKAEALRQAMAESIRLTEVAIGSAR